MSWSRVLTGFLLSVAAECAWGSRRMLEDRAQVTAVPEPSFQITTLCAMHPTATSPFHHLMLDSQNPDRLLSSDNAHAVYATTGLLNKAFNGAVKVHVLWGNSSITPPAGGDGDDKEDLCHSHNPKVGQLTPFDLNEPGLEHEVTETRTDISDLKNTREDSFLAATSTSSSPSAAASQVEQPSTMRIGYLLRGFQQGVGIMESTEPGAMSFLKPSGMCQDPLGNLYLADHMAYVVYFLNKATGLMSIAAGTFNKSGIQDGQGTDALLQAPEYLVCLPDGSVLVADIGAKALRLIVCNVNCPRIPPFSPRPAPPPAPAPEPSPSEGGGGGGSGKGKWPFVMGLERTAWVLLVLGLVVTVISSTSDKGLSWIRDRAHAVRVRAGRGGPQHGQGGGSQGGSVNAWGLFSSRHGQGDTEREDPAAVPLLLTAGELPGSEAAETHEADLLQLEDQREGSQRKSQNGNAADLLR